MKKVKILNLKIFLVAVLVFLSIALVFNSQVAEATDAINEITDLSEVIHSLFGDETILSIEYLYNLDNMPDYIYIDCDRGYAVCKADTLEILEYSPVGELPYKNFEETCYYVGPGKYYTKSQNQFINILTGEILTLESHEISAFSNQVRNLFYHGQNKNVSLENYLNGIYRALSAVDKNNHYPEDTNDFEEGDLPGTNGSKYIDNYEYFFSNPRHGYNSGASCAAIATQLLLSYNNYYNDRRIIPDKYLNGWNYQDNKLEYPECNPNYCGDPDSMNRETLGTSGFTENDQGSYFNHVLGSIPEHTNIIAVKKGINNLLNSRNNELSTDIDFNVEAEWGKGSVPTVDEQVVKNEVDAGRPMYLSLRGPRERGHAVVAYGYQKKHSTMGYIVHFGWSEETEQHTRVWVNSAWCRGYVTLRINHTHHYDTLLENGEARCSECKHRTNAYVLSENSLKYAAEISKAKVQLVGDIEIPSVLFGKKVKVIGESAFANQKSIASITLPDTVTTIGLSAFQDSSLQSINFAEDNNVSDIGSYAFAGSRLSQIAIPPKVRRLSNNVFHRSSLRSISFAENCNIEYIDAFAFAECKLLKDIELPTTVKVIGGSAFKDCWSLGLSVINNLSQLNFIGDSAFYNCKELMNVKIPKTVTYIGASAFENCEILISVSYDYDCPITEIKGSTFAGCKALSGILLPKTLKRIGANAFKGSGLPAINVPKIITNIEANAFADCDKLSIYTEYDKCPTGWVAEWNKSNRHVITGCELGYNPYPYVLSFVKSDTNPTRMNPYRPYLDTVKNPLCYSDKFVGWYTNSDFSGTKYETLQDAPDGKLYAKWENSCIAEGSLITLADGTQKPVEQLTGEEQLLVWNLFTGTFDVAPILFIDSDPMQEYEIINLHFADGTTVKVISEHAFWDCDLNKYVYLRADAAKYIGHRFNKQTTDINGKTDWTKVQLVGVELTSEVTTAWSPVTYGHLCYYVNGMLSMPGATESFVNIFDVDADKMKIDEDAFAQDIETYGLFTYEEFKAVLPIPEVIFKAFGGRYLKVAIGKGLTTMEELAMLIRRYEKFFN